MGVKGLLSLLEDWDACRYVCIERLANDHRRSSGFRPILAIDGSNFIPWIYAYRKDALECIYGGQWIQFKEVLENFVLEFKKRHIKLVFIFDGTKCEEKWTEWIKRRMDRYKEIASIFDDISQNLQEEVISRKWVSPAMRLLAKFTLKELGVRMYQTDTDVDPDNYIAAYAKKSKAVFAILSDDSDFIILDTKPVLSPSKLRLDQFETVMYDRRHIAERYLNLSIDQLSLFACLMGNDSVPLQKLKLFHQRLAGGEKPFKEAKARNLCRLINQKEWTGDHTNKRELSYISREVFGHRSDLIKRGLESYIIENEEKPLTFIVSMSPEFEEEVHERHFNCSNSLVYNLLCKKEYSSSEALEDGSTLPSALVYREIRQRCYGILFNCSEEPRNLGSTIITERCWYIRNGIKNDLNEPEEIHPLPLRHTSDIINIEDLWLQSSDERRFEFFWHALQIPMEFDLLMKLSDDQVALSCILNYLIGGLKSGPLLKPLEVAVFVAQSLWELNPAEIRKLENPQVGTVAVNLSTLFINGVEAVLMALETCGFPCPYKYVTPSRFFDGKLFHYLYNKAQRRPMVRVLCNNQDEIIEKFHRLLPIITNNTIYDTERFEWRRILEDF